MSKSNVCLTGLHQIEHAGTSVHENTNAQTKNRPISFTGQGILIGSIIKYFRRDVILDTLMAVVLITINPSLLP